MTAQLKARLLEYRELAPGIRHFVFEVPGIERLEFLPGQFLSLTEEIEGKRITRAYSIASPPDCNRFELCLNRVQDGLFSPHLFGLEPGQEVDLKGPYGAFTWRTPPFDSLLVATGTGIAPFRSMLLDHFRLGAGSRQITLLLGARHEHGLLYRHELEDLARRCSNFQFCPTLTQPGPGWTGRTGRVQAHLMEALADRRDLDVYICGLREMVDDLRARLKDLGFERRRIIYEKYD